MNRLAGNARYCRWSRGFTKTKDQTTESDVLDYKPLVKLMKKTLPHGLPEVPKVHKKMVQAIGNDGYIDVEKYLSILNKHPNITDNVKKHMTKNKRNFFFSLTPNHLDEALKIEEGKTWFRIKHEGGKLFIRSNFGHTLPHIDPEMIADREITKENLENEGNLEVFIAMHTNEIETYMNKDHFAEHKTHKFWTNLHPPHYENKKENEDDWAFVYFNIKNALDLGMRIFMVDERVFVTKGTMECDEEELKNENAFFKITRSLFYLK